MKKILVVMFLPVLSILGVVALWWLYVADEPDDYKSHPYGFRKDV